MRGRHLLLRAASLLGLAVASGLVAWADLPATDAWPLQRGTPGGAAAGAYPREGGALKDWAFTGRPAQVYTRGAPVWGSPAFSVVAGRPFAFIGGNDQALYALDLAAQRCAWSKVTNGRIVDAPVVALVNGQQAVFWGSSDRFVYAHAAADGRTLWTRELVPPSNTQGDALVPAPFCEGDAVYVACFAFDKALERNGQQAWLFALDAADGRERWRFELPPGPMTAPVGCRIDGELFLFQASRRGLLQAIRVSADGPVRAWSFQMPHEVMGSPAVLEGDDPLVFLGSKFGDVIAVDARIGARRWSRMTGNWVDNNVACGRVGGRDLVFVGSNDYRLYALDAAGGGEIWAQPLGAEVYSAPCFFTHGQTQLVAAACLDDHLYVADAASGAIVASFYTGQPAWDKVAKGETLWGSPIAVTAGGRAALVHGSYDGAVYVLPLDGESRFRATLRTGQAVWANLAWVGLGFACIVLPLVLRWGAKSGTMRASEGADA